MTLDQAARLADETRKPYVYIISCGGKYVWVGLSTIPRGNRIRSYRETYESPRRPSKYGNPNWVRFYRKNFDNLVFNIRFYETIEETQAAERYIIAKIGRRINKTGTLFNLTSGGELSGETPRQPKPVPHLNQTLKLFKRKEVQ